MDTGATSGATAKREIKVLKNTALPSTKVFMLPEKSKISDKPMSFTEVYEKDIN